MADSYNEYVGNGSTKTFTVSFPYIDRSHVKVYVNDIPMANPSDWQWSGANQITLTYAPATNSVVKIKRDTPLNTRLVDFQPGAVLTEADLDLAHTQHHYNLQELRDGYESLLDGGKIRLAGANGIAITNAETLIDNMVAEVLASELAATLQAGLSDIDTNGQNVLDIDARMVDLEATVDAIADIDGTGLVTFIQQEQTERIDGDNAILADLALLGAKNGANTAWVLDTTTVKLDSDTGDTLSTRLTALQAGIDQNDDDVADNYAAIIAEASVRASADGSLASDITALTSTVGGHTTSLATQASVIDGLEAQYTVKVDNNGYVAGFGLASTAVNGTPTSSFIVLADKFSIIHPANGLATAKAPFVVSGGNVYMQNVIIGNALIESLDAGKINTGTLNTSRLNLDGLVLGNSGGKLTINGLAITSAHLGNGVVTNAKIAALAVGTANIQSLAVGSAQIGNLAVTEGKIASLAVSTLKIANQAVTVPTGSYTAGAITATWNGGLGTAVSSVTINPESAPVFVIFSFYRTRSGDDANAYIAIKRGGTTLLNYLNHKTLDTDSRVHLTAMYYDSNPGSGTHTYYCYARPGASNDSWSVTDRVAFAIGMKK